MPDRSRCRPSSNGWARAVAATILVVVPLGCGDGAGHGSGGAGGNAGKGGTSGGGGAGRGGSTGGGAAAGHGGAAGTGVAGGGNGGATGRGGDAGTGGDAGGAGTGTGGTSGTTGSAGAGGTAGTTGNAGSGGASGTAGTAGNAGNAGNAGTTGGAQGAGGAGGRGGSSGSGGAAGAPAPLWDWTGVVGTGQSLAVGGHGNAPAMPIGATTQRFHNLKLSLGSASVPPFDPSNSMLSMVPLVETIRPIATGYPSAYPRNIYGETFHTAMADELSTSVMASQSRDFITVHTVVGEAGQLIAILQKGAQDTGSTGRAYAASLFEVGAIARLAKAQGKTYGVGAIVLTHGEGDANSATFEADMVKLWQSYNQDLPGLTGQTAGTPIPMLLSQQHSAPTGAGSSSAGTLAQWRIGLDHPGEIVCTGPKYQYAYVNDNTHLTNPEYERLGEKYGEVMYRRAVLGEAWQPLQPTTVERSSARVITVHFHVPSPPLAWDATLPMPHQAAFTEWAQGRGFEVHGGTARLAISGVAIAGDTVQITTAADLPATGVVVGYASTADGTIRPNGTVRWGQLRDSDPFVGSLTRATQPNYCVAFELPVP